MQPSLPPPTSPAPAPASRVAGPAIAIIVAEGIGICLAIAGMLLGNVMRELARRFAEQGQATPPFLSPPAQSTHPFTAAISIAGSIFVIYAMVQMKDLKSWPLALAGTIVAMLPVASSCCCLGLPLGIWSLVVLTKPEVKAAFT